MDLSKFQWHGSEEELNNFVENLYGKLVDPEDWNTVVSDKEKYYDAQEFLNDADHYYMLSPPNLVQTSAKLWLACVYCVNDYYLQLDIHAVSYRSLKYLMELAAGECSGKMARDLTKSWTYAEQFHQYSYGSTNFKPNEFEMRKAAVESFVSDFESIDKDDVFAEAMKLVNCSNDKIALKTEAGKTSLGRQSYSFKYKAY